MTRGLAATRNRYTLEPKDGDGVIIIEDSAHRAPTKVFLAAPSSWLTAEEARELGMELLYRASDNYKPGEDE